MAAAEGKVADSLGTSMLKSAGSAILGKLGGVAVNAALGCLGINTDPDAAVVAELAKMDEHYKPSLVN